MLGVDGLPYALRNGKIVAANFQELIDDGPRTGISLTEQATALLAQPVWTNTTPFGETFNMNHCADWTSSSMQLTARVGINAIPVEQGPDWDTWLDERQWTNALARTCGKTARLYCFEDGTGGAD